MASVNHENGSEANGPRQRVPPDGNPLAEEHPLPDRGEPRSVDDLAPLTHGGAIRIGSIRQQRTTLTELPLVERMQSMYGTIAHLENLATTLREPDLSLRLAQAFDWRRQMPFVIQQSVEEGEIEGGSYARLYLAGLEQLLDARLRTEGKETGSAKFPSCTDYIDGTIHIVRHMLGSLHDLGWAKDIDPQRAFEDELYAIVKRRPDLREIISFILSENGRDHFHNRCGELLATSIAYPLTNPLMPEIHALMRSIIAPPPEDPAIEFELASVMRTFASDPAWHEPTSSVLSLAARHQHVIWEHAATFGTAPALDEYLHTVAQHLTGLGIKDWRLVCDEQDMSSIVFQLRTERGYCKEPARLLTELAEHVRERIFSSLSSALQLPNGMPATLSAWPPFWDHIVAEARSGRISAEVVEPKQASSLLEPGRGRTLLIYSPFTISDSFSPGGADTAAVSAHLCWNIPTPAPLAAKNAATFATFAAYYVGKVAGNESVGWGEGGACGITRDNLLKFLDRFQDFFPKLKTGHVRKQLLARLRSADDLHIFVRDDDWGR